MAFYVKKENLGSRPPPSHGLRERIENTPGFQAMRRELARSKDVQREGLKEKWDTNAEVQRWRTLTAEERGREAVDRLIPTAKALTELRNGGHEVGHEEARKVAEKIAYKADRQKAGE